MIGSMYVPASPQARTQALSRIEAGALGACHDDSNKLTRARLSNSHPSSAWACCSSSSTST